MKVMVDFDYTNSTFVDNKYETERGGYCKPSHITFVYSDMMAYIEDNGIEAEIFFQPSIDAEDFTVYEMADCDSQDYFRLWKKGDKFYTANNCEVDITVKAVNTFYDYDEDDDSFVIKNEVEDKIKQYINENMGAWIKENGFVEG